MPSLVSLADQFEQMDRALTTDELAQLLAVSHVTIFKLSKVSGIKLGQPALSLEDFLPKFAATLRSHTSFVSVLDNVSSFGNCSAQ